MQTLSLLAVALALAGCRGFAPDVPDARIELPEAWGPGTGSPNSPNSQGAAGAADAPVGTDAEPELAAWWQSFGDPRLDALIVAAIRGNRDLAGALERVQEARARRGISRQDLFPVVDADASANFIQFSENDGQAFGLDRIDNYTAGLTATWELDLWGRVRNAVEAADQDLAASVEDVHGALVAVAAETAAAYIDLASAAERTAIAERNLALQSETLRLTDARLQAGLGDELSVAQARTLFERTRSAVPALRALRYEALTRIALLTGQAPDALEELLRAEARVPAPPARLEVGPPNEALRRRPDVRRAERLLAAQAARVGVAEAELFPQLVLFGDLSFTANDFGDLLQTDSLGNLVGPRITLPVFRGGARRAQVGVEESRLASALIDYEQTLLAALQESHAALQAYGQSFERAEALDAAQRSAALAVAKSEALYEQGLVDFQSVVDSQRELVAVEDERVAARADIARGMVRLVRAVGGGWEGVEASAEQRL